MKYSIIVCTRNRDHSILKCLDAVSAAMLNAGEVGEIVVVDNGSTDSTHSLVREWANRVSVIVNLVSEPRQGLSNARNSGLRAAKGDLLLFTDDDCFPHESFVREALAYFASDSVPVLRGGSVHLGDPTDLPMTIKIETKRRRWHKNIGSAKVENLGNAILGANMAIPRLVVEKLGDFDTCMGAGGPVPAGEDTDYAFRAYIAGIPIEYVPDMIVYHFHGRKKQEDGFKLMSNYIKGSGALYAKFIFKEPDLCRQLFWDVKGFINDARTGRNSFMPEIGYSHANKLIDSLHGAWLYLSSRIFARIG